MDKENNHFSGVWIYELWIFHNLEIRGFMGLKLTVK